MILSSFYLAYILLPTDRWSFSRTHIGSKWTDPISPSGYDSEIAARMIRIDNVVFAYYKTLSFLFYVTRNMDIFLLITQASWVFINIYHRYYITINLFQTPFLGIKPKIHILIFESIAI